MDDMLHSANVISTGLFVHLIRLTLISITITCAPDKDFNHDKLEIHKSSLKMTIQNNCMSVYGPQSFTCQSLVEVGWCYTMICQSAFKRWDLVEGQLSIMFITLGDHKKDIYNTDETHLYSILESNIV